MNYIVLLPVFVLVALTFGLGVWMGGARFLAIRSRQVRVKDIALGQAAWPQKITQIGQSYQNQLELPVLFYALVAMVLATHTQTFAFVFMEWLFGVSRLAHAFTHVTSNNLRDRFLMFAAGALVLLAMWIWFFARVTFGI